MSEEQLNDVFEKLKAAGQQGAQVFDGFKDIAKNNLIEQDDTPLSTWQTVRAWMGYRLLFFGLRVMPAPVRLNFLIAFVR